MAVTVVEEGEIKSSSNEKKKRDSKFVLTAGKFYGDADMPCCVTTFLIKFHPDISIYIHVDIYLYFLRKLKMSASHHFLLFSDLH